MISTARLSLIRGWSRLYSLIGTFACLHSVTGSIAKNSLRSIRWKAASIAVAVLRSLLTHAGAQKLHCQTSALKDAIESHQHLVTKAMVDMWMANECIGPIDSRTFSRDHAWREIMANLNELPPDFDAFKYQALKMYTQYMEARAALLEVAEPAMDSG